MRKSTRRFVFGTDHGPAYAMQTEEKKVPVHIPEPPTKSEQEQEAEAEIGAETQLPPPTARKPKASRRRAAADAKRTVNGDVTEPDGNDAVQPPTIETSVEPPDVEAAPPPPIIPTLDIGNSHDTQTEAPRDLTADTTFIKRENPISSVEWSPADPRVLFTGGPNESGLHKIETTPSVLENLETRYEDVSLPLGATGKFEVERFCWTAAGEAVVAVSEGGSANWMNRPRTRLVRITNWGEDVQVLGPISGIVFSLQYQPVSQLLLCICGLDDKSIIHVWRLTSSGSELICRKRPVGSSDQPVTKLYDAAWIAETEFIVCGDCELQIYDTKEGLEFMTQPQLPETPNGAPKAQRKAWSRLRYDPVTEWAAVVDSNDGAMLNGAVYHLTAERRKEQSDHLENWLSSPIPRRADSGTAEEPHEVTDFQWQPIPNKSSYNALEQDRLLALSTIVGDVELYGVRQHPHTDGAALEQDEIIFAITRLKTFSMGNMYTAAAFTFSPDGFLIAAAGFDAVFIWRTDDNSRRGPRAHWKWKAHSEQNGVANGTSREVAVWVAPQNEEDFDWPQSLQWDADGKKLAFGVNDRVAIIRL